jgi:hypothetical protein
VRRIAGVASAALGAAMAMGPIAAFAQNDSGSSSGGGAAVGFIFCCYGVALLLGLALLVLWVWMLIDLIQRPETDFAGGMTKTTWLIIMLVSWVVSLFWVAAAVYYFAVYRKLGPASKRAAGAPPAAPMAPPPAAPMAPPMAPPAPTMAPPMAPPAPPMAPPPPPMAPPAPPAGPDPAAPSEPPADTEPPA